GLDTVLRQPPPKLWVPPRAFLLLPSPGHKETGCKRHTREKRPPYSKDWRRFPLLHVVWHFYKPRQFGCGPAHAPRELLLPWHTPPRRMPRRQRQGDGERFLRCCGRRLGSKWPRSRDHARAGGMVRSRD